MDDRRQERTVSQSRRRRRTAGLLAIPVVAIALMASSCATAWKVAWYADVPVNLLANEAINDASGKRMGDAYVTCCFDVIVAIYPDYTKLFANGSSTPAAFDGLRTAVTKVLATEAYVEDDPVFTTYVEVLAEMLQQPPYTTQLANDLLWVRSDHTCGYYSLRADLEQRKWYLENLC